MIAATALALFVVCAACWRALDCAHETIPDVNEPPKGGRHARTDAR